MSELNPQKKLKTDTPDPEQILNNLKSRLAIYKDELEMNESYLNESNDLHAKRDAEKIRAEIERVKTQLRTLRRPPIADDQLFSPSGTEKRLNKTAGSVSRLMELKSSLEKRVQEKKEESIFKKAWGWISRNKELEQWERQLKHVNEEIKNARADQYSLAEKYIESRKDDPNFKYTRKNEEPAEIWVNPFDSGEVPDPK